MGTVHDIQIKVSVRNPQERSGPAYSEQFATVKSLFRKHNREGLLFATNLTPVEKWDWHPLIEAACKETSGLVFSVHSVSDRSVARIDYHVSGLGYVYSDHLVPNYDEKRAQEAIQQAARWAQEAKEQEWAQAKRELAAKADRQEQLRQSGLQKLSAEERYALGLTNPD